jgi:hypothetical protein
MAVSFSLLPAQKKVIHSRFAQAHELRRLKDEMSKFSSLYSGLLLADESSTPELESILKNSYRRSWKRGSQEAKMAVLSFIGYIVAESGLDLVREGLQSKDTQLVSHAIAVLVVLSCNRLFPGTETMGLLSEIEEKFPHLKDATLAAFTVFAENGWLTQEPAKENT